MKILEIDHRDPRLVEQLTALWEASVRRTHLFLSPGEVEQIKKEVPQAIRQVPHLVVAEKTEGAPAAFMGVEGRTLAMLFVAPEERSRGIGGQLVRFGVARFGLCRVTVNQQNPKARGFYEHMGFRVLRCTQRDEQGRPYPLLYMELEGPGR